MKLPWRKSSRFSVGYSRQQLLISQDVLKHFEKHQQRTSSSYEAGGQLFAKLFLHEVSIEQATGPRRSDYQSRTLYVPDRFAEQIEIDLWHQKGLHYVGDWHTHPASVPQPSVDDIQSIRDSFCKSRHSLHGFLLVIVGTAKLPAGLYVSLNNAQVELVLQPVL